MMARWRSKEIELISVPTIEQPADFPTKTLPGDDFRLYAVAIMHAVVQTVDDRRYSHVSCGN